MDRAAGWGPHAQPAERLRGELHPVPRARLRGAASRFMRALCHHYGVELHNFTPNAISQAATFVGICEGDLGIRVNWDL
jgi:hypothetical protein